MRQVIQQPGGRDVEVMEVPAPQLLPGCAGVRIGASLVSSGTERAASEFAAGSLLRKARTRPDLVREVVSKVRRDGLLSTVAAVRSRLDQPLALGYSSAGTVVNVAEGITDLRVGDRVACAGVGSAVHAELACVPRLLLAKIPGDVAFEQAAFATVGAVVLHGIRTADAKLGDFVAIIGLGLLGQLTVQILKAAGCRVAGFDIVAGRAELALTLGADAVSASASDFRELCLEHSGGLGADAVLITAETASSEPVNLAGEITRDRAVVVAVGTVGMEIERRLYYEKELDFRISRSYGPGRYDAAYEQKGRDYPIGYVRWTETRNLAAFLQLLEANKLDLGPLITHRFSIEQAGRAYDLIAGRTPEPFLGVVITYPDEPDNFQSLQVGGSQPVPAFAPPDSISVGVLGAGAFATQTLIPAIAKSGADLAGVCTANGWRAHHAAQKFGFCYCTTDEGRILSDPSVNTVVIASRHHRHAEQVIAALGERKHVFCEKPLCLNEGELEEIVCAYSDPANCSLLTVGFNRRFAPMARKMKTFLADIDGPLSLHYRVNAGFLPADHWINDPEQGGGRLLGEVCHFIDFLIFLADAIPVEVQTRSLEANGRYGADNVSISIGFANGSQGTVDYLVNGDRRFSKERVEAFGGGAVAMLEDFRKLELVRHGRRRVSRSMLRQDKGHRAAWEAFCAAIRSGKEGPIPFDQIVAATLATLRAARSRSLGRSVTVDAPGFIAEHSLPRLSA